MMQTFRYKTVCAALTLSIIAVGLIGCQKPEEAPAPPPAKKTAAPEVASTQPTPTPAPTTKAGADSTIEQPAAEEAPVPATPSEVKVAAEIPRFGSNSPFDVNYKSPIPKDGKRLWARSALWEKAPEFVVEKWLGDQPDTKGKVVLIEFWATWCGPCRRSIPLLNAFQKKYGDDLVVIGVSDETEAAVRKLKEPAIEYFSAIDTQARMKKELAVTGIPHVIVVEPDGFIIWEGFPLLKDYELTEKEIGRILKITSEQKAKTAAKP